MDTTPLKKKGRKPSNRTRIVIRPVITIYEEVDPGMYDHFQKLLRSRKLSHHCLALMRGGGGTLLKCKTTHDHQTIDRALASAFDNL